MDHSATVPSPGASPARPCLRYATVADQQAIHELFCVPAVYRYLADGVAPPPDVAAAWIESARPAEGVHAGGLWVLPDDNDSRVLGLVRLAREAKTLQLTYLLHPDVWGRGLATAMSQTVMALAFDSGEVASIRAGADAPNEGSIAVMLRLGMRFRGEVAYPMGPGVEYEMAARDFDRNRCDVLPVLS